MANRELDSLVVSLILCITVGFVASKLSFMEGARVRECPAMLDDGRPLRSRVLATGECFYAAPVRQLDRYSPAELREIATTRARMEKVK